VAEMAIELLKTDVLMVMIAYYIVVMVAVYLAPRLGLAKLRSMPQIEACLEAVRVCGEKGGPLFYGPGGIGINYMASRPYGSWMPAILALLKRCSKIAGELGVRIYCVSYNPITALMCADYMREGYTESGHPEMYNPDDSLYYADYIAGTVATRGLVERTKPSGGITIGGHWWHTGVTNYEALARVGAFQVGGDVWPDDGSAAAMSCDYVVFGEEATVMGTYLNQDEVEISCFVGEDVMKLFLVASTIISAFLYYFGVI
jgi:hypothetical protein